MKILAIETSCDDTGVAVLKASGKKSPRFNVLSNIISSQTKVHKKWGGVVPTLAKREHQKNLVIVLQKALSEAKMLSKIKNQSTQAGLSARPSSQLVESSGPKLQTIEKILEREPELLKKTISFLGKYQKPKIDAIAVTIGPGLEPALWVGVNFAKALAYFWNLPIIPVNHIEAHILANFIGENPKHEIRNQSTQINLDARPSSQQVESSGPKLFPAICLVVSGGHTQLILMKNFGKYQILGETRDDAAGECFDKVAKILNLGYPGGPIVAALASKLTTKNYGLKDKLPRPMIYTKDYDFSFSGLKTAVLYKAKELKTLNFKLKTAFCAEIQQAIIDVLTRKTFKAALDFGAKSIILGGGVAANDELRKQFSYKLSVMGYRLNFLVPPKNLCTDNAAMAAIAAFYNFGKRKTQTALKIKVNANLRISYP